jgi:hypothetical protein
VHVEQWILGRSLEDHVPDCMYSEDRQQLSSSPAMVMSPVSKAETEERTPVQREVQPQDIG